MRSNAALPQRIPSMRNNATWSYRTYIYTFKGVLLGARLFFVLARVRAHVLCHGASFLGMSFAKARFEGIAKVKIILPA